MKSTKVGLSKNGIDNNYTGVFLRWSRCGRINQKPKIRKKCLKMHPAWPLSKDEYTFFYTQDIP